MAKTRTCEICNGTGEDHSCPFPEDCTPCDGCGGSGRVPDDD